MNPKHLHILQHSLGCDTFGHDVLGIRRHINRTTGELGGMFLPRTSLPDKPRE